MAETKPTEELYDLATDPHELKNLAQQAAYADTLQKMRVLLNEWIAETGDRGLLAMT